MNNNYRKDNLKNQSALRPYECIKALTLCALVALSTSGSAARAKAAMTITERQESLMRSVNKSERSGELTLKEANSLRDSEDKILSKEDKMKSKNGGKLSYKNIAEIERDLNKMSERLQKQELAKRVLK